MGRTAVVRWLPPLPCRFTLLHGSPQVFILYSFLPEMPCGRDRRHEISMDVLAGWKESLEYLLNAIHRGAK